MYRAAVSLASKARAASSSGRQIGSRLSWSRNYASKDIKFGVEAQALMHKGVEELADAVKVTMWPKVDNQEDEQSRPEPLQGTGRKLSAPEKKKFLVYTLLDLKDSKEAVYGTLDAWVAFERIFPLVSLKRALIDLEKDEQWHRVVQVIKWMLSKGQGTTMGTYEQLIRALEKDNRAEEAHRMWVKKISHNLHSVPWKFCNLMINIYYRNNMLERLVKLFKGLESYDRKPPSKSVVQKVADAYEMLGLSEDKNRVLEKYSDLFSDSSEKTSKKSRKGRRKHGKEKPMHREAGENVPVDSGPSDEESESAA